jgi:hypothetical protein
MPFISSRTKRQHYDVLADTHHVKGKSRTLDRSYIADDSNGERWVYAGMVVAKDWKNDYVPYSAGASYGGGSDTAVGVLVEPYDLTYGDKEAAPAIHALLVEDYCFVYGQSAPYMGNIPSAVKTALSHVMWT